VKIVHVITKAEHGGAQSYVDALASSQCIAGHDVVVIAGEHGPLLDSVATNGASTHVIDSLVHKPSLVADRRALSALRSWLWSAAPDVVHLHSSKAGLLGRVAARSLRIPAVYTAHGWPFQRGAALRQRLQSWTGEFVAARFGGHVIVLTDRERDLARRQLFIGRPRLHVVPIGIRVDDSIPVASHDTDDPVVVMVARFAPPKRFDRLIAALAENVDLPWTAVMIGDGPGRADAEARATGLGDRVRFTGDVDDVPERLAAAQIAALASDYEGFPMALLEAMRAGCCCIADDLPGVRAMFGGEAGVVVADPADWPADLRSLLVDRQRRERYGTAAQRRVAEKFEIGQMCDSVVAVYESAISARDRTAGVESSST
jgi:glycosyltransferase involved in cell wall biosynthesis